MNIYITALMIGCGLCALVLYLMYRNATTLTPNQQVFQDAHDLIERQGLYQFGFTPRGASGVGNTSLPHCITAAVAACTPDYYTGNTRSIYGLWSTDFLRQFSHEHLGMYPEDLNDKTDKATVLQLLLDARDAA